MEGQSIVPLTMPADCSDYHCLEITHSIPQNYAGAAGPGDDPKRTCLKLSVLFSYGLVPRLEGPFRLPVDVIVHCIIVPRFLASATPGKQAGSATYNYRADDSITDGS